MIIRLLKEKLKKTRDYLRQNLKTVIPFGTAISPETLQELEAVLIQADLGLNATNRILDRIKKKSRLGTEDEIAGLIKEEMLAMIRTTKNPGLVKNSSGLTIVLFVGVNGTGKTSAIAKLAYKIKNSGNTVLMAACDTFRAAAIEQLEIWAGKLGVEVIKHGYGNDPSAVAFDAVNAAKKRDTDYLLIDTAGRFHTKSGLVEELKKIERTIGKCMAGAPHEKLLVVDASTGQNALAQAKEFNNAVNLTGIIFTKMDGTAKGGVLVGIQEELNVPVKYIGVGQDLTDLEEFSPEEFVDAIL